MNKSYRLIWSRMKEAWVVVSEKVAAKAARPAVTVGCFAAAFLLAACGSALALDPGALPTGGRITSGIGGIEQSGATLTVNQQTGKLIAQWDTFDIGRDAAVRFNQPGVDSVALNRILDQNPSQIFGNLSANGQIFLLNPAGIVFGRNARVDVGGLVASSLDLVDVDFLADNYHFSGDGGGILNQGDINAAEGGVVALIAPRVTNEGTITTPDGSTLLAAGNQVSLDFNGDGIISYSVEEGAIDALLENQGLIKAAGGLVVMTAGAADSLTQAVVNNEGVIEASSLTNQGGRIILDGGIVVNTGSIAASGVNGGTVTAQADYLMNAGTVAATGSNGDGGQVLLQADRIVQTDAASLDVSGTGTGGDISLIAGAGEYGGIFSSAEMTATGEQGGRIILAGNRIDLRGAMLDASGEAEGGSIRVGGDLHGGAWSDPINGQTLTNAQITDVSPENTLDVSASSGEGGSVVVWSDQKTYFYGDAQATGAAGGGFVEISSKDRLQYGGSVDASSPEGAKGTVLFDPKNIVIDNAAGGGGITYTAFVNPNPSADSEFGSYITTLSTGNMVVTDALADVGAVTNVGAVYLFKADGTLISTLTGSHAEDQVSYDYTNWQGGTTALTNGNFAVSSPAWDGFKGAVTWGDGTTGVSGIVSSANSLVGSQANDRVGSSGSGWNGVYALTNGNYVVTSPCWANGANAEAGAATWVNGSTGQTMNATNTISSANSLIGSAASDWVGYKYVAVLTNGNYAVVSPWWDNDATTNAGAVTWGNGSTGTAGTISSVNSLVGTRQSDSVGMGEATALTNGNYVVSSFYWHDASNTQVGAATWVNGSNGQTMNAANTISSANSLVGSTLYDNIGSSAIIALTNGNYAVISRSWDNGALADAGAATWGDGANGTAGTISSANSLIGTAAGHDIGGAGAVALDNGNYVVMSPYWDNGATLSVGAATWVNGSTGQTSNATNSVSSANSLIGSSANNRVGSRVTVLPGGNYVVGCDQYNSGAGSATWVNGSNGQTMNAANTISSSNSLVGSTIGSWNTTYNSYMDGDHVGENITVLTNGNYVVNSPQWNSAAGAVTWGDKDTGVVGTVSSSNSLVGTVTSAYDPNYYGVNNGAYPAGDKVGSSVTALTNGNYVVGSYNWSDGGTSKVGAATWGNGTSGITGTISAANSLIGSTANDKLSYYGIVAFDNGNYVVSAHLWDNGADVDAGAVTWADGATGLAGTISADNSLIGAAGKQLGTLVVAGTGDIFGTVDLNYAGGGVYAVLQASSYAGGYNFADNADQAATLTSASLTDILNTGSNLVLQANNDITVTSAVAVNNAGGDGGNLIMQAGRSILLNANITTDNGDLILIANETAANGVVDAQRDAGAAAITMAGGTSIDAGAGAVNISLKAGDDKTNFSSGGITLTGVTAGNLMVRNQGLTADSGIAFNGTTTLAGDLTVEFANGILTQGGPLAVSGTTGITAGAANNVTLDNASNDFTGAVSVVSGNNVTLKDINALTLGTVNVSGNLIAEALGGDLALSGNISKTSGADSTATFKTNGNIIQNNGTSVSAASNKLNTIFWADSDAANGGGIHVKPGATISSNGGDVVLAGGADSGGDGRPDGYAKGTEGVNRTPFAPNNLDYGDRAGVLLEGEIDSNGGHVTIKGAIGAVAANTTLNSAGVHITQTGEVTSGAGNIELSGYAGSDVATGNTIRAIWVGDGVTSTSQGRLTSTSGHITLTGLSELGNGGAGILLDSAKLATGSGNITLTGTKATGENDIMVHAGTLNGNTTSNEITSTTGNLTLNANDFVIYNTAAFSSAGVFTFQPRTAGTTIGIGGGAGTLQLASSYFSTNFSDGFSDITIGNANAGAITVGGATSFLDNTTLRNNSPIAINGALTANEDLTLTSNGAITQSAALAVTGTTSITAGADNNITLTNTSNNFSGAVSVVSGNNVSLIDSNAMTLGAVTAAGLVDIATLNNDLTLTGAVTTSDTTANAIKLNAGKSAAAGTPAGGNIIISGGTFGTGTGGFATLYSGSATNADLTALLSSGSGRFRYNADETTDFSVGGWTALSAGTNAIYREQPTVTLTAGNDTKDYDGLAYSGGNGVTNSGFVNGDTAAVLSGTLTYGGTSQGAVNAGSYSLTPGGYTNGLGYGLSFVDGSLTVAKIAATVTANSAAVTYNGLAQSVSGFSATGLVDGETSAVLTGVSTSGGSGTNAGSYTNTASGTDINYTLSFVDGALTIAPKALTVVGMTAQDKVYDGTSTAVLTGGGLNGVIGGDTVGFFGQTGEFIDKNVGSGKSVTVTGVTLGGVDSGNYTVSDPTGLTADITQKIVSVDGLAAENKIYDGTTDVTIGNWGSVSTGVGDETLTLNHGTATFADKNAGTGKTVTADGYSLVDGADGGLADNYTLSSTSATTTADITAKAISADGITAGNKVYDATTAAILDTVGAVLVTGGVLGTDAVILDVSGTSGSFADKNVGTGKAVAITGLALAGTDAGNYTVIDASGASADITAKVISVDGLSASNKIYDATTAATLNTAGAALVAGGVIDGDTVTLNASGASGSFADKNFGTGKAVTVSGLVLAGTDAGNYTVIDASGASADITAKAISADGLSASNKIYDATTAATLNTAGAALVAGGVIDGDTVTLNASGARGSFADKNVGTGKAVTGTGLALAGADAGNYSVSDASGATADIDKKALIVTADARSKTYGDADPSLTYSTDVALVDSDSFTGALSRTAGENVDSYAIVQNTLAIDDGNTGNNYNLTYAGADLTIQKRALGLTADPSGKIYGEADPELSVSTGSGSLGGVRVNDSLADVTGVLSRETGEDVGRYDILLGNGAKAGNYAISFVSDNKAFTIERRSVPEVTISREVSEVLSSLTSAQTQVNGTQEQYDADGIPEFEGRDKVDVAMGPGGSLSQGTLMDGLVIDRTGYADQEDE